MFKKKELLPISIIILTIVLGFIFYSSLPEQVPSHWNAQGQIDDYSGRMFSVIFFPALTLFIYLLMSVLPNIDPLKKNYEKFSNVYFWTKVILVVFMSLMYIFTLLASLELITFNIRYMIIPLLSLLYLVLGYFMPKIKKNYFYGIRTPWTLNSEEVWDETHKMAGKLFIGAGIISLFSILFEGEISFIIFMVSILGAAFGSVIYSYIIFKRLSKRNGDN
jgi:uncharacterized membrane protein